MKLIRSLAIGLNIKILTTVLIVLTQITISIVEARCLDNNSSREISTTPQVTSPNPPDCSGRILELTYDSSYKKFTKAAVAVGSPFCATVLLENGSAVDAAIATGICDGISSPQSMGIGGGHFMLIYLRNEKKMIAIDSREVAPIKSSQDMFVNKSTASSKGGLATGVPGEIAGYWLAHQLAGKLPWKRLLEPTIKACREGVPVSINLASRIKQMESSLREDPVLSKTFINPVTNTIYKANDTIKYLALADTLEKISIEGADAFYNGSLSKVIVQENNLNGGIITLDDLRNYKPEIRTPIEVKLNSKYRLFTLPPPSSGALVAFTLNVMSRYNFSSSDLNTADGKVLFYHRLVETFKHAYSKRSYFGDSNFVNNTELLKNLTSADYIDAIVRKINDSTTFPIPYYDPAWLANNDHGTSHFAVLAENGDAVSFTSTINTIFGALYAGNATGIIYNSEMDDFSTPGTVNVYGVPASEANYIKPGKRPMSSMSPSIILDENNNVRLVIGAAGGTRIITATATVATKNLLFDVNLKDAIDEPRVHHQLAPNEVGFEKSFPSDLWPQKELMIGLMRKNHNISCFDLGNSIVQGIARYSNGDVFGASDFRKGGIVDGY